MGDVISSRPNGVAGDICAQMFPRILCLVAQTEAGKMPEV